MELQDTSLPIKFVQFLRDNGISQQIYAAKYRIQIPRYVRVNPRASFLQKAHSESLLDDLEEQIVALLKQSIISANQYLELQEDVLVKRVPWLHDRFYEITPPLVNICNTDLYMNGDIYGVDAASGAAVEALLADFWNTAKDTESLSSAGISNTCGKRKYDESANVSVHQQKYQTQQYSKIRVLDLCCAPGMKFCHLADQLVSSDRDFSLVGVDVSQCRIAACHTLVAKYIKHHRDFEIKLVQADGTQFFIEDIQSFDFSNNICGTKKQRKKLMQKKKSRQKKVRENQKDCKQEVTTCSSSPPSQDVQDGTFDYVLVDAECSHDGSIKHIDKYRTQWGMKTLESRIPWIQHQSLLCELQLSLLKNAFRNLKVDGVLIYSTCSFTRAQNEDIIQNFLVSQKGLAKKVAIKFNNQQSQPPCTYSDDNKSMARFDPVTSSTSGLFIAKLTKVYQPKQ
eukprot:TRINITY_DN252_c23_g1_i1.p1 TRINITY_DN252_c23_g1~~TRINITY_DN252_c23_g1_i1.p1  ORF type:complete len:454 (+),score=22.24 TRINITY_DN252_c23_g1_i1:63-1424(+)